MLVRGPRSRATRSSGSLAVLAFIGALVLVPSAAWAAPGGPTVSVRDSARADAGSFSATVTWNGANINTAGTDSAALSTNFASSVNVLFNWTTATGSNIVINDARLQMIYFGFSLATRDVLLSTSGSGAPPTHAVMNWTPGAITYVLEGVYQITASLLATNGSTVWSENFYVRASAPFSVLAALPILLLAIGAWELYSVARSGREAALSRKPVPPSPPPSGPASPPESPPEAGGTGSPPTQEGAP